MAKDEQDTELNLAGLSEQERAALEDTSASEDADALRAIAGEDDDDDDNDNDDADAIAEAEARAAADAAAATGETDKPAAAAVEAPAAEMPPAFTAELAVVPVENFEQKMADIKTQKDTLRQQLDAGEIDMNVYEAKRDELNEQATDLRIQQTNAENAAKQNEHVAMQRWEFQQEQFFALDANKIYQDRYLGAAFNEAVKDLAADEANSSHTGTWFLQEADRMIRERFQIAAPKADDKDKDKGKRRPDLGAVPPTLSGLPAAESTETGSGEFAYLDKLEGIELEQALASMPKDKADRYLREGA